MKSVKLLLVLAVAACGGDDSNSVPDAAQQQGDAPVVLNMTTALSAALNANHTLDNAGYGVNSFNGTLRVEVHKGGFTGCPEMTSPTPDYTLILAFVPAMTADSASSPASFFDYVGDMTDNSPAPSSATVKTLTNVVYSPGAYLTFDVNLAFSEGTITGHLYAPHCTSLDG